MVLCSSPRCDAFKLSATYSFSLRPQRRVSRVAYLLPSVSGWCDTREQITCGGAPSQCVSNSVRPRRRITDALIMPQTDYLLNFVAQTIKHIQDNFPASDCIFAVFSSAEQCNVLRLVFS